MSKPWKGWIHKSGVVHGKTGFCARDGCTPGVWTPIEDESLPHPGDGREWERMGARVKKILTPPVGPRNDVVVEWEETHNVTMIEARLLRERKPEPEHRPWCPIRLRPEAYSGDTSVGSLWCKCERRSGEDRRQGERRKEWPYWVSLADRRHDYGGDLVRAKRGGRSGEDRRQS